MQCQTDKHDERLKKTTAMFAIFEPIGCEHWEARTASLAQRIVLQQVGSLSCSRNLAVGKMGCGLSDKGFEDRGLFCRVSCERFLPTSKGIEKPMMFFAPQFQMVAVIEFSHWT